MVRGWLIVGLVFATVAGDRAMAGAAVSAGSIRFELDRAKHSELASKKQHYFRRKLSCKVVPIHGAKRRFVRRAIYHARRILRSSRFRAHLQRWRGWTRTRDNSRIILARLTRTPLTVHVTTFRRDPAHPCNTHLANHDTNAFVPDVQAGKLSRARLLFVSARYLDMQYHAPSPIKGMRNLAKTLVHEALHIMGYSHAGEVAFSARYNNTVPVYIGCLVMNWGENTEWAVRNCHLPTAARRKRSPYRWLCYTRSSLRRYVGDRVRITIDPHPVSVRRRTGEVRLLRVREDDTLRVRWRNGRIDRVNKCRLVL